MKKFLLGAAVGLCFLTSVPASAATASFNITDVIRASDTDLNAALADANAQGDTFAAQCYSGVLAYNAANPQHDMTANVVGPVSGFQTARDVVKAAQSGAHLVPDEIVSACGPLALDVQGDLGRAGFSILGLKF